MINFQYVRAASAKGAVDALGGAPRQRKRQRPGLRGPGPWWSAPQRQHPDMAAVRVQCEARGLDRLVARCGAAQVPLRGSHVILSTPPTRLLPGWRGGPEHRACRPRPLHS